MHILVASIVFTKHLLLWNWRTDILTCNSCLILIQVKKSLLFDLNIGVDFQLKFIHIFWPNIRMQSNKHILSASSHIIDTFLRTLHLIYMFGLSTLLHFSLFYFVVTVFLQIFLFGCSFSDNITFQHNIKLILIGFSSLNNFIRSCFALITELIINFFTMIHNIWIYLHIWINSGLTVNINGCVFSVVKYFVYFDWVHPSVLWISYTYQLQIKWRVWF